MAYPLLVSHATALGCLRAMAAANRPIQRLDQPDVPTRLPAREEMRRMVAAVPALRTAADPLHVLVAGRSAAHAYAGCVVHGLCVDLPSGALWKVAPGVAAAGPELALVQCAAKAQGSDMREALGLRSLRKRPLRRATEHPDAVDVLMLCYELCGSYALGRSSGLATHKTALTTVAGVEELCAGLGHMPGVRTLRAVLPFALDRARSPMEARLTLVLCLPVRLGGYGLPWPRLNVELDARPTATDRHDSECITPDLYWDYARYAIEYDSRAEHERASARDGDSIRRSTMRLLGTDVDTVRTAQLLDLPHMDNLARLVARRLGVRLRHQFDPDVVRRRVALRRRLFRGMRLTWGDVLP